MYLPMPMLLRGTDANPTFANLPGLILQQMVYRLSIHNKVPDLLLVTVVTI
jgi:hypothetical protein